MSSIFFAYAGQPPLLAETLRNAAKRISDQFDDLEVRTWEDLRIGGQLVIDQVTRAIDDASLLVADLTQLNENVLFEFGYAIARGIRVLPTRDASDNTKRSEWSRIGLFDTVGQARFTSSDEIVASFSKERPDLFAEPLSDALLAPHFVPGRDAGILHFAELFQTDAGRAVVKVLTRHARPRLPLITADPNESSVHTIAWYAQQVYSAAAVVVHFTSQRREGAGLHNARASFVAGLAHGMRRPVLLLAEEDHDSPLDYKDMLFRYDSAASCSDRVNHWLGRQLASELQRLSVDRSREQSARLNTELGSIDLGEYVAENESAALRNYFVETSTYRSIIAGESRVYVGAKGVGKTAIVLQAEAELREDKRNLVCAIKPAGYDLEGIVRLFQSYEERDTTGHVAEALWKYLLTAELCFAVERDSAGRPAGAMPNTPDWDLIRFLAENDSWLKRDFAARIEGAVERLEAAPPGGSLGEQRDRVAEALYRGPLKRVREILIPALAERERVFLLMDNLDKSWGTGGPVEPLSRLLLGLLSSMDAFRADLRNVDRRSSPTIASSIFIRSDIFQELMKLAREPDKLPARHMSWTSGSPLLEVVEARYRVGRAKTSSLWDDFFVDEVENTPVRDWILRLCQPKPRDVLFVTKAALDQALNNRRGRIESADLIEARRQYSMFAFEAAVVEARERLPLIEDILLQFAGLPSSLSTDELNGTLSAAGIEIQEDRDHAILALRDVGFLGIRFGGNPIVQGSSTRDQKKAAVLSSRAHDSGTQTVSYEVHPAFRSFLEIEEQREREPLF